MPQEDRWQKLIPESCPVTPTCAHGMYMYTHTHTFVKLHVKDKERLRDCHRLNEAKGMENTSQTDGKKLMLLQELV